MPAAAATSVEYELFDVAKQERLLGFAMTARASAMRDVAHQIADAIYEKILGVRGAFWTRIAYVTATGTGGNSRYALMVADSDGYNPQTVVRSHRAAAVAVVEPGRQKLAYVSFEQAAIPRSTSRTSAPARASGCPASAASTARRASRRTAAAWR